MKTIRILLAFALISGAISHSLFALPSGQTVVNGNVQFATDGSKLNVSQLSDRAIVEWNSFSIGGSETVQFLQNSSSSAILNHVTGGSMSSIEGRLNANGQVFLINPAGIFVGEFGSINTAGFLASTAKKFNADAFMDGDDFKMSSAAAPITIRGSINAGNGAVYLLANTVSIEAGAEVRGKSVAVIADQEYLIPLASGMYAEVDMDGSRFDGDILQAGKIESLQSAVLRAKNVVNTGEVNSGDQVSVAVWNLNGQGSVRAQTVGLKLGSSSKLGDIRSSDLDIAIDGHLTQHEGSRLTISGDTNIAAEGKLVDLSSDINNFNRVAITAENAKITDKVNLVFTGLEIGNDLEVKTKGTVTSTAAINVGDQATFDIGSGKLDLSGTDNDFGGVLTITAGAAFIKDINSVDLGRVSAGPFELYADGRVRQFDALTTGWNTKIYAPGHDIVLTHADNHIRGLSVRGNDVSIASKGDLDVRESHISDDFDLAVGGNVTSSGALRVADRTDVKAGKSIRLNSAGTDFGGRVLMEGKNIRLSDENSIDLESVKAQGNLDIVAGGRIMDSGAVIVSGTATLTSGEDIRLDYESNDFNVVRADAIDVVLSDANDLILVNSTVRDDLQINAHGKVTAKGALTVDDTTYINAHGNDIVLNNPNNDFTGLVTLVGKDISIRDRNALDLDRVEATGDLDVKAFGRIRDFGALQVAGNAHFDNWNHDTVLDNPLNEFTRISGKGVEIKVANSKALDLGSITTQDDLYIDAQGDVTGLKRLKIADQLRVHSSGDVSLTNKNNDIYRYEGFAQNVTLNDRNNVILNDMRVNDLTVNAPRGSIELTDSVEVRGVLTLNAKKVNLDSDDSGKVNLKKEKKSKTAELLIQKSNSNKNSANKEVVKFIDAVVVADLTAN